MSWTSLDLIRNSRPNGISNLQHHIDSFFCLHSSHMPLNFVQMMVHRATAPPQYARKIQKHLSSCILDNPQTQTVILVVPYSSAAPSLFVSSQTLNPAHPPPTPLISPSVLRRSWLKAMVWWLPGATWGLRSRQRKSSSPRRWWLGAATPPASPSSVPRRSVTSTCASAHRRWVHAWEIGQF